MKNIKRVILGAAVAAFLLHVSALADETYVRYVGTVNAADDAAHGLSPDAPFATVAQALSSLASVGSAGVVQIAAGDYDLTETISLTTAIQIVGAGRDATRLYGRSLADSVRGATINHAGAKLSSLSLLGCTNTVDGAGIHLTKGTIEDCRVAYCKNRKGSPKGAGIYINGAGTVRRTKVDNNYLDSTTNYSDGGGLYVNSSSAVVEDCEILDNYAPRKQERGLGIYMSNGTVRRCLVQGNYGGSTDSISGSGVYMGSGTLENCQIVSNGYNGVHLANGTMRNCLVTGHVFPGYSWSGVYMAKGNLQNCTITGNISETDAEGVSGLQQAGGTAVNNIVWGNGPAGSTLGSCYIYGGTFNTNIIDKTVATGTGNIVANPLFADAAANDFRLRLGSPAVDAAQTVSGVTTDIDGVTRPQGAGPDIGCHEFVADNSSPACAIVLAAADLGSGDTTTLRAAVAGVGSGATYAWTFDGQPVASATGAAFTPEPPSVGTHTVALAVMQGGSIVAQSSPVTFEVHPRIVYVDGAGSDTYPYDTAAKAAHSVNAAAGALWADTATPGRLNIAGGTYLLSGTLAFSLPVEILGAGRDATILCGGRLPTSARGLRLANAGIVLRGLTVTGCTNDLDGAGIYMAGGRLENIRVTRIHQLGSKDNQGAGIYMTDGTVTNCLVDYNYIAANWQGTAGIGIYMTGGLVTDTVVCHNWMARYQHNGLGIYVSGGTVRRCEIFDNYSTGKNNSTSTSSGADNVSSGHGMYIKGNSTLVEDCRIYSNGWNGVMLKGGTLRNCLIFGHRCTDNFFAGVNMSGGTMQNCTITDNVASKDSSGKSGLWQSAGTAVNNIIYGNGSAALGSCYITGGTFNTNLYDKAGIDSSATAIGNYELDPGFVGEGDFHLKNDANAKDKGAPLVEVDHDLDGTARPQLNAWDLGCYEYAPGAEKSVSITFTTTSYPVGGTITASAQLENIDPATAAFTWTLSDGAFSRQYSGTGENYASFSCSDAPIGAYALTVEVVSGGETFAPAAATEILVKPDEVFVASGGSDTWPYDAAAKAAHNFTDALNALWQASDTTSLVHVAAGEYPLRETAVLGTPVRVLGAGRDATILSGAGVGSDMRGMFLNHSDAIVRDITLSGCTNALDGAGIYMAGGLLDNVRVTKVKQLENGDNQGAGIYMTDGTVTNCLIDGNFLAASWQNTAGIGIYMTGGLVTDTVVCHNWMARNQHNGLGICTSGGTVRRCVVFDNYSTINGGSSDSGAANVSSGHGMHISGSALVEDCRIFSNGWNGVMMTGGTLRDCLIYGHHCTGSYFAGVNMSGGRMENCTIADNVSDTDTTGKSGLWQSGGTAVNNIVWGNGPAGSTAGSCYLTGGTFNTNLVDVAASRGTGNIVGAESPFKNRAKANYRLAGLARDVIDRGDNAAWTGTPLQEALDLDGRSRLSRRIIDLGCFEYTTIPTMLFLR